MSYFISIQLQALVELARTGSMAAAAEALGYTPSAVSQQLARLEQVVGAPLVIRAGRGVRLTNAGRVLVEHAGRLLRDEELAVNAARATTSAPTGPLTVGVFGTTSGAILAPLLIAALARDHPEVEVESCELPVDECSAAVGRHVVDVAFGVDYSPTPIPLVPAVDRVRLLTERFDLAVPSKLVDSQEIGLADVRDEPWVLPPPDTDYTRLWVSTCRAAGFEPWVRHEITDTAASLALARAGVAVVPVTPLMRKLVPSDVAVVRLQEDVERHVVFIRHQDDRQRPAVRASLDAAERALRSLGASS